MKLIPAEATLGFYLDLDQIMNDKALEGLSEEMGLIVDDEELKDFGMEISEMYSMVGASRAYEAAYVAVGQFDFTRVRMHLISLDFTKFSYKGVELWRGNYDVYDNTGMAIFSDALAWGDRELVESFVRTIKGADNSFEDLPEVKEVLNKFPEWPTLMSMVCLDAVTELDAPPGVKNGGFTMAQEGGHIKLVYAFNCIDASTALEMEYRGNQGAEGIFYISDSTWIIAEEEISTEEFYAVITSPEEEYQNTEYRSTQTAVNNMMVDNGLSHLAQPQTMVTNDMTKFPDTSVCEIDKLADSDGNAFSRWRDLDGWVIWQCDVVADSTRLAADLVNYVTMQTTAYWYTIDAQGNITQYSDALGINQTNP
ncbi:hypothetical protein ACFLVL_02640 [Chloroflexota bacterium]